MQTVTILRDLWRMRLVLCLIAMVAVVGGYLVAYRPSLPPEARSYSVGIATAKVLVDTPRSQVVEILPRGYETLSSRADVLASLMVDGEIKSVIARNANLPVDRIFASSKSPDNPDVATTLTARSLALTTSVALNSDMSPLPIIKVETQAPTIEQAISLANAAVAGLTEYLDVKAVDETIPDRRRIRVRPLGTAQGHQSGRGPGRMMAIMVAVFLFGAGCALALALSAVIRGWRAAVASERTPGGRGDPPTGHGSKPAADSVSDAEPRESAPWPVPSHHATMTFRSAPSSLGVD
jgi:hypothetical protein